MSIPSLSTSFLSPRLIREERPNISVALPPKAEQALRAATAQPDQSLNAQLQRRMIAGASSPHLAFEAEYTERTAKISENAIAFRERKKKYDQSLTTNDFATSKSKAIALQEELDVEIFFLSFQITDTIEFIRKYLEEKKNTLSNEFSSKFESNARELTQLVDKLNEEFNSTPLLDDVEMEEECLSPKDDDADLIMVDNPQHIKKPETPLEKFRGKINTLSQLLYILESSIPIITKRRPINLYAELASLEKEATRLYQEHWEEIRRSDEFPSIDPELVTLEENALGRQMGKFFGEILKVKPLLPLKEPLVVHVKRKDILGSQEAAFVVPKAKRPRIEPNEKKSHH